MLWVPSTNVVRSAQVFFTFGRVICLQCVLALCIALSCCLWHSLLPVWQRPAAGALSGSGTQDITSNGALWCFCLSCLSACLPATSNSLHEHGRENHALDAARTLSLSIPHMVSLVRVTCQREWETGQSDTLVVVWWLVRNEGNPTPFVLLGSPGIGKSFGVGSHPLYEPLRYAPGRLYVVAFFVHEMMYIFYLPRGGEAGRVERYTKDDGVERVFTLSDDGKQGYMILDAKETMDLPTRLPARLWGSIMLSSPNKRNFKVWRETNMGTRLLYINCYHAREMKACFAWLRRADLVAGEGNAGVRTEPEKSWRVMEERMREVGHAPRCVFDEGSYRSRKDEVEWTLNKLIAGEVSYFLLFLAGKVD
ncbi:putative retrotransposon hot spot protein 4 (RHS4) [Trypanosoma vivax]|nr:putative retrotransposon hot spot protein 4 (RHS4) [Trypanosoma vivax]